LILALDAAADRVAEEALLAVEGAHVVRGARPGASANRNAGLDAARAPLVLFCDDDTIPVPAMLGEHLAWHRNHPQAEVAVLGLVRWAPELRVTPFMRWLDRGIQFDYPFIDGIEAGWGRLFSANVSLKRTFVGDTLGGFDAENFPFGYEDLDLGLRASEHGLRLLFNRAAVADHLREMTVGMWQRRIRRIAASERRFVAVHPGHDPWFKRIFESVAALPPARGRGRSLTGVVPPGLPWLGPKVWESADLYFKQLLAPGFLDGWAQAAYADHGPPPLGPDLSERDT
jgi:GT2 family glycosyltransferase